MFWWREAANWGTLLQALDIELESSPHHGAVLVQSLNYQAARRSERAARSDGVSCQIRKRAAGLVLHGDQIGKVTALFIRGQIVVVSQVKKIAWHAD